MTGYEIRPITSDDVLAFWGRFPDQTIRGYAVDYEGELACIAGVTVERRYAVVFSEIKEGINAPKVIIWRATNEIINKLKQLHITLVAVASADIPGSDKFLERLGFTYAGEYDGEKYYGLKTWQH